MTDRLEIQGVRPIVAQPGDWRGALDRSAPLSDHISRMMARRGDALEQLGAGGPDAVVASALADIDAVAAEGDSLESAMRRMRRCATA